MIKPAGEWKKGEISKQATGSQQRLFKILDVNPLFNSHFYHTPLTTQINPEATTLISPKDRSSVLKLSACLIPRGSSLQGRFNIKKKKTFHFLPKVSLSAGLADMLQLLSRPDAGRDADRDAGRLRNMSWNLLLFVANMWKHLINPLISESP